MKFQLAMQFRERELKQSGDFQSGDAGNVSGKAFHLVRELFIHSARRFIHCGANQVLQHFLVFIGKNLRLDLYFQHLFLPVHFHGDHAAAGRSFNRNLIYLSLQIFLDLPQSRKHLLESADFHN